MVTLRSDIDGVHERDAAARHAAALGRLCARVPWFDRPAAR
jgi:hypothetical protein